MEHQQTDNRQAPSDNTWNPTLYEDNHSFVWKYGAAVIELLAPQSGERILDLGCGTGQLTTQIADAGAEVVGIDNAQAMIDQARKNYPTIRFELADGASFAFPEPFDAVFSNAAIHWMRAPEQVVARIANALKPGGRFVAEFGGKGNVRELIETAYDAVEAAGYPARRDRAPWYYPSIGEYSALLEQHGLAVTFASLFDRPTPLEGEAEGLRLWLQMFGKPLFQDISNDRQSAIFQEIERRLRPGHYRDGTWFAPYRRLRIAATKEAAR